VGGANARFKAQIFQAQAVGNGAVAALLGFVLFRQRLPRGERVGDFVEGGLHGLLVGLDEDFLLGFADCHGAVELAAVEDGDVDAGGEVPAEIRRFDEAVKFGTTEAEAAGERDAGVECRTCCTDVAVRRFDFVFGFANIRALL